MSTKAIQGRLWSIAPQYWSIHFEPYFLPLYRRTLEQLTISEDTMLLDAGCGAGLFTSMAIGAGAQVIGVDAAPGLLAVARQRNPENNFLEEDLESLPFADESFDVITGFNSFQYAGSFENALKQAKRVLKTGGQLAMAIWDKPELSDGTVVLKAISTHLPPPPPGTPGPFALSEDGKIEAICASIGLKLKYKSQVTCPFLYRNIEEGVQSYIGTGPAAAALNHTDEATVEKTIEEALQPFRIADGMYYNENNFLLFIVEK